MDACDLAHAPRFVALGGGHGLGRVLSALSWLGERLTGIVTTSDDGGSSGRLRRESSCIAWGDIRHCMNELVANPTLASLLFEHRFAGQGQLAGHSLGNLMLLGADQLSAHPLDALNLLRDLLGIRPHLIPMSEAPCDLVAVTRDGRRVFGECAITAQARDVSALFLSRVVDATPEAVRAIAEAHVIILAPGSFYSSTLAPLLVPALREAVQQSRARKIWLPNLTSNRPAESPDELSQMRWLRRLLGPNPVDHILWPQHRTVPQGLKERLTVCDLACHIEAARHDRQKLREMIEATLWDYPNAGLSARGAIASPALPSSAASGRWSTR